MSISSDFLFDSRRGHMTCFTASLKCAEDQFQCWDSGKCIQLHHVCDNYSHCNDRSDEMNCGQFHVTTVFTLNFLNVVSTDK